MTKKTESIEARVEAVEYYICRSAKLTPEGLVGLRSKDEARWKAQAAAIKEKEASQRAERKRKEKLIDHYRKHPPNCPKCKSPSKYREVSGVTGTFMEALQPGPYWKIDFICKNEQCRLLHTVHPDALDKSEEGKDIVIDPADIEIEEAKET